MTLTPENTASQVLQQRQTLHLCTAGSVDDGKSTFVGRLLHDTKSVLADQLSAVERTSREKGLEHIDLSLLVDGLRAEREQGITIDVAYRYFSTAQRTFILADTPGHVQYTRNTVTGVSTSDVVVLLVDARHGVVTQTRRHLSVAGLLGIKHVILAVNKIDLVDFSQEIFENIRDEFTALAHERGVDDVNVIPISALLGDNVVEPSENTPWYDGPTVLHLLETIETANDTSTEFRFPIQYVIRDHGKDYRGYAGRVTAGSVRVGDTVATGNGLSSTVTRIETTDGAVDSAGVDDSVVLLLADDVDLSRGDLLSSAQRPEDQREFTATLVGLSEKPLKSGAKVNVRYGTSLVRARIRSVESVFDIDSSTSAPAEEVALNDIATVNIQLAQPLPVEQYSGRGRVGSFLVIDAQDGNTLAAGLVGRAA
ncbi:sulfate adenylyltransferase subunit 1 [Rothia terrae]|uniref:sulfate adenylyltransferase n=1 Tax=Rothia terrae TaxID=396015 RepID=A0A7H2BG82_9MICC|nr:GTP-binding protein [Rothia terrae]QNV38678.1 50S ribosome-binding GTPase [Rothia terrae]